MILSIMRFSKLLNVLLLLLITACTPQPAALATPAQEQLPTLSKPPTRTATPFLTPTATAAPTVTSTPTVTATPTGRLEIEFPSPDRTMRLLSWDYRIYDIVDADGKVIWSFPKDTRPIGSPHPTFDTLFTPLHWFLNEKELIIASRQSEDNNSTKYWGNQFVDADGVFRFDVETGEMTEVLPELEWGYYAAAVSPDASQMVYANQTETPVKIKLLDLQTMEEKTLFVAEEKILEIGSFGWSPDMSKLIFSTMEVESEERTGIGHGRFFNIFLMDLKSLEVEHIIENTEISMDFHQWIEPNLVRYRDSDRSYWLIDLNTHELSKIEQSSP